MSLVIQFRQIISCAIFEVIYVFVDRAEWVRYFIRSRNLKLQVTKSVMYDGMQNIKSKQKLVYIVKRRA